MGKPPGRRIASVLRSIGAALAGYVVIVGTTSAAFAPLGGIVHVTASPGTHLLAALIAVVCGLMGGAAAAWVGGYAPVAHAAGTAAIVSIESAFLLTARDRADPLWFELLGAAALVAATIGGGWLLRRLAHGRKTGELRRA